MLLVKTNGIIRKQEMPNQSLNATPRTARVSSNVRHEEKMHRIIWIVFGLFLIPGCNAPTPAEVYFTPDDYIKFTVSKKGFDFPWYYHNLYRINRVAAGRIRKNDIIGYISKPNLFTCDLTIGVAIWNRAKEVYCNIEPGTYNKDEGNDYITIEIMINNNIKVYRLGNMPENCPIPEKLEDLRSWLSGLTWW